MRGSDAATLTTAAYHETLAGTTKNALDFAQFLSRDQRPYFDGKVGGLVVMAGREIVRGERDRVALPRVWERARGRCSELPLKKALSRQEPSGRKEKLLSRRTTRPRGR
jgi:hypothetical protein